MLWTRATSPLGADTEVDWLVRALDGTTVQSGSAVAQHADDHTVHVEVDRLEPATDYEYEFRTGDETAIGRTRTLPGVGERLRFGVVCCSRWGWPGFELFDALVDEHPDVVLHLGDSIYEIGEQPPNGEETDPPWDCETLDDYRRRYRQHRSHPALRRLHGSVPMLAMWDDHEVADNAPDPSRSSDRRRAGQRAWAEWMPMRLRGEPAPLDRSVSIEGLIDLVLVDTRFAGRTPADTDGPASRVAGGTLLDRHQWQRLEQATDESDTPWFVVANQVQVGPMTLGYRPAVRWPPWKRIINRDQWDGYPSDRAHLDRVLRRARGERVVVSGDLHSAWSRTLEDARGAVAHEFTAPSISGLTYAHAVRRRLPIPARALRAWLDWLNPGIDLLDPDRHGYLVCDVTPQQFTATFVFADGDREVVTLTRG